MAGCWIAEDDDGWAEECWTGPRGGMMMGSGRAGRGERLESWEFMRIEVQAGKVTFSASPQGALWTTFAQADHSGPGLAFVNPANDYPQRVRYWRDGERLMAEIALLDGSKARRWTFRRTGE